MSNKLTKIKNNKLKKVNHIKKIKVLQNVIDQQKGTIEELLKQNTILKSINQERIDLMENTESSEFTEEQLEILKEKKGSE